MDPSTINQVVTALTGGNGIVYLLIFVILSGSRRVWVFGREVVAQEKANDQMRIERDMWRDLALSGTSMASQALATAQAATAKLRSP